MLVNFKLQLRWKTMFSIAYINHMSCLSTMIVDFRNIFSSINSYASNNHCIGLITKNIFVLLYIKRINPIQRWHGSRERSTISAMNKYNNQSSKISALIQYYEIDIILWNEEMNKNEQYIWEWKYSLYFSIKNKSKEYILVVYSF